MTEIRLPRILRASDLPHRSLEQVVGYQARGSPAVIVLRDRVDAGAGFTLRRRSERAPDRCPSPNRGRSARCGSFDTQTPGELYVALQGMSRHGAKLAVVGADLRVHWVLGLCDLGGLELCDLGGLELQPSISIALAWAPAGERRLARGGWRGLLKRRRPALG